MSHIDDAYRGFGRVLFNQGVAPAAPRSAESWMPSMPSGLTESPPPGALPATLPLATPGWHAAEYPDELLPMVRRILQFSVEGPPLRSLLFAAVDEGSSGEVCAYTGAAIAEHGAGVCIVEADLASSSLAAVFHAENAPGLSDVLCDGHAVEGCLTRVADNLSLLPAGSRGSDAAGLIRAESIRSLLRQLRDTHEYVLIHGPALSRGSAGATLGSVADGVVMVVAANSTRREVARSVQQALSDARARIIGAVLVNRTYPIPAAIYRAL